MPDLTITISDDDLAQIAQKGIELGKTTRRVAEQIIHRSLTKTSARPPVSNLERAADRIRRQIEIARRLDQRGLATLPMAERAELAVEFGVTLRTITRDLELAHLAVRQQPKPPKRPRSIPPASRAS